MKIYLVEYRIKNGGHKEADMVTAGGSYDLHKDIVITASSAGNAKAAVLAYAKSRSDGNEIKIVNKIKILGDA